jgi:CDP-glucose 4,6-dehydratase
MRVAVTGAYGLVGSWLCAALLDRGDDVAVLRHAGADDGAALVVAGTEGRCDVVTGDVGDRRAVGRLLDGADLVFHLAGRSIVADALADPVATYETNVRGTWTVLDAARAGAPAVVVASSYRVYGTAARRPWREDDPLLGTSPYDASKRAAEVLAQSAHATDGLRVAWTRFANVYGGGDRSTRLVPDAVTAVLDGRPPVVRSDGSPERDLLHVDDAVAAYLAIGAALLEGRGAGEAYNAGSGRPVRVLDVVEAVCRAAGSTLRPQVLGAPADGLDRQAVDASKLHALAGWSPRTGLDEGLRRTVAWYREHGWQRHAAA